MNTTLRQSAAPRSGAPIGSTGAQPEALIKEAWQRRRRRRLAGGAAVTGVLLVAAVVALMVTQGTASRRPAGRHLPTRAVAGAMPSRVVVWAANWRIEVRSSRTGRLVRTLATNVAKIRRTPVLALAPSGTLFFDHWAGTHERILSVPLAGGRETAVGWNASEPAVSPDGRLLAYVTNTDGSSAPEAIVVRNLITGAERHWAFATQEPDVAAMSWSPDGRSLSFTLVPAQAGGFFGGAPTWVLDTRRPGGSLGVPGMRGPRDNPRASIRRIPLGGRLSWACYLTSRTGVAVIEGPHRATLFLVDVATGRVIRRLTSVPSPVSVDNVSDGPEEAIQADPTGRYLLIAAAGPAGDGELYRWAFGMRHPVPFASGVVKAIWAGA